MNPQPIRIIIVGAGAAGIRLAHVLSSCIPTTQTTTQQQQQQHEIIILEANDYIGGRVCSFEFEGHTVEKGANWISGRENMATGSIIDIDDEKKNNDENPIWKLAKEIQLNGFSSGGREDPNRMHVIDVSGSITTTTEEGGSASSSPSSSSAAMVITSKYLEQKNRFDDVYAKALEGMSNNADATTTTTTTTKDIDVRTVLEKYGWTPKSHLNKIERAVEHNALEVWVTNHLEALSGRHDMKPGANDMDLGQDEMFVEDTRGFSSIFQGLVDDLNSSKSVSILLGKQVKCIHYEPGNVKVVVAAAAAANPSVGATKSTDNNADEDTCTRSDEQEEEEVYNADIVVSTVSLGVLQSGTIQFVPPLPDWKVKALNEVEMFTFAKVYASFRKRLWPDDKDYLLFVTEGEEKRGYYPLWMKYRNTEKNLLMCYLGGSQAERVESLTESQIKDEIEELFSKAFPLEAKEDCRPVSVAATNWSKNPRFCGSYSSFPVGAFENIPEAHYRSGLTGVEATDKSVSSEGITLYFAGEAFDDKFNGWVQGGYLSGERVARTILENIYGEQAPQSE